MIYLKLFLSFLKIGAVSFGGGYGMISLIRETVIGNGWLSEEKFLNFIAVSESTPGPLAVNIATFVGAARGGIFGALAATAGVVLPAFVIILLIAAVTKNLLKMPAVNAFLAGVRPCVAALILATAVTMLSGTLFNFRIIGDKVSPDIRGILIFALLAAVGAVFKIRKKDLPSPILMIGISAGLGILFYGII